jgi:ribokinase
MKFLNFGSLNIDFVYNVPNIVREGETLKSSGLSVFCGGKGLNQSVALARAGAEVWHAGKIGSDGDMLIDKLSSTGVNVSCVKKWEAGRSGNALIQVDENGQNSIILYGGANQAITLDDIDDIISHFEKNDIILLQNEINFIPQIIKKAKEAGLLIAINPAPMEKMVKQYPMEFIDVFIVNEIEGAELTGKELHDEIISEMEKLYPNAEIVLTLGSMGVIVASKGKRYSHGIYDVHVVDTTAAGDTFIGYYLSSRASGKAIEECLRIASIASALAVSRQGAADSIPDMAEVMASRLKLKE